MIKDEILTQCRTSQAEELMFSSAERGRPRSRACRFSPSMALVQRLLLIFVFLLFCGAVSAQTPPGTTPPDPCAAKDKGLKGTAKCLNSIYDKATKKQGVHLVTGVVVPGSGMAAGVGYTNSDIIKSDDSETWRSKFDASARVSTRKYWEFNTNLRLTRTLNKFSSGGGPPGDLKINIYALIKDMPRLDFFGIGPNSREQDRAVYHYREGVLGADISSPVESHLDIGGAFETILPRIRFIKNPTVRSVERVYSDANAPGIRRQPVFLRFVAFAGLHSAGQPESRMVDYKFFYNFYQDVDEHRFSFRRFDADLKHKFPFGKNRENEIDIRGRLSFSETKDLQRVPFYLLQTLGGSNISNEDTLRGFRDYRFRDRDLALLQLEYMRTLYGPIDLIAFYDTGKVAPSISRFDEGRLRHTYGLGLVIKPRRGDNVLFRFYVAFGSGEGMHTYFGLGDLLGGRPDRLVR